ncbi:ankyrin repeat domain-containing protein [Legionella drancourtii]|uniref:Uncharacterized protein n=1 Tax=Legionella drancourtii LLAP12 TaxID=658187 RepID=G9ENV5_9GAMM|nr:hypothetical protein [Legionella drancourtii]EHL31027.1 hypothetical protein LDG_6933 [Legionella drancourtii LLAP12]
MTLREGIINSYNANSSTHELNDAEKANLLFDIVLKLIIQNKWTYFAKGKGYSAEFILNCNYSEPLHVNCFELSQMFAALCAQVGISDVDTFVYKNKPSSKIGQKLYEENSESKYTFQCFDAQFECIDNQICFDQHSVVKVNGRFYDLIFSCAYEQIAEPYDVGPLAQAISSLYSNNEMEALQLLQKCNEDELKQTIAGESLLHIAAGSNFLTVTSFLLGNGVDANKLPIDTMRSRRFLCTMLLIRN